MFGFLPNLAKEDRKNGLPLILLHVTFATCRCIMEVLIYYRKTIRLLRKNGNLLNLRNHLRPPSLYRKSSAQVHSCRRGIFRSLPCNANHHNLTNHLSPNPKSSAQVPNYPTGRLQQENANLCNTQKHPNQRPSEELETSFPNQIRNSSRQVQSGHALNRIKQTYSNSTI